MASGGAFTRNGATAALEPPAAETSLENIANVVSKHVSDEAQMSNAGVR